MSAMLSATVLSITVSPSPKYEIGRAGKSPECPNLVEVKLLHIIRHVGRKRRKRDQKEKKRKV